MTVIPITRKRDRLEGALDTARRVLDAHATGSVTTAVAAWTLVRAAAEVEPFAQRHLDLPPPAA
jgi:hypothetical protein